MLKYYRKEIKLIDQTIIDRCKQYQGDRDPKEMLQLYMNLAEEEYVETIEALDRCDIIEYVDGVCDQYRVARSTEYFAGLVRKEDVKEAMKKKCEFLEKLLMVEIFIAGMWEVCRSNFTKSKEKDKNGKIIKGDKYSKPDIAKVTATIYQLKY